MVTITYARVERGVTKTVPCRVCGKKLQRSTTLYQTISQFNKNATGRMKTRQEIQAELKEQAETWRPTNDIHARCVAVEEEQKTAPTYRVAFERIGRRRDVPPLDVQAASPDKLTDAIFDYVRQYLASRDGDVSYDLATGEGWIEGGRFGTFTVTEVKP